MSNLKSQIVDIINNFLKEYKLVDARTCEGEFLGMHSSLTVAGANEVVEELEALISDQVAKARITELTISRDRFVPGWEKDWFDDRIAELKGDDK